MENPTKRILDNKYSRMYFRITERAFLRSTPEGEYTEKHHIIPKSLGGRYTKANLVRLTPKEHYICHHLLTKCTQGEDLVKMLRAWFLMATLKDPSRYVPAIQYDYLRRNLFTDEFKAAMSEARRKDWAEGKYKKTTFKGSKTEEHRRNVSKGRKNYWANLTPEKKEEHLRKLREAGKKGANKTRGTTLSDDYKQKVSEGLKRAHEANPEWLLEYRPKL